MSGILYIFMSNGSWFSLFAILTFCFDFKVSKFIHIKFSSNQMSAKFNAWQKFDKIFLFNVVNLVINSSLYFGNCVCVSLRQGSAVAPQPYISLKVKPSCVRKNKILKLWIVRLDWTDLDIQLDFKVITWRFQWGLQLGWRAAAELWP